MPHDLPSRSGFRSRLAGVHRTAGPRLSLVLIVLVPGACAPKEMPLPRPLSRPSAEGDGILRAGFARVDITPPPGYGMFGFGSEASVAVGHRSRLYARSLVLQGVNGELIAFAVADLGVISTLLHRRVADKVLTATDSAIGADRLMLAATHTHSAPGHFLSGWPLNQFGSGLAGYDSAFVGWLAGRIARSVVEAYGSRLPARAGWAVADVWGHTRNRSYEAYVLNSGVPSLGIRAPEWLPDDLHRAVNPHWAMLRVDVDRDSSGTYSPAGALSIFAIHGTGFPSGNDLYDADIHGLVARGLARRIGAHGVHLFASSAQGDVSANWPPESRCEPASLKPVSRLGSPRTPRAKDDWHKPPAKNVAACVGAAKAYVRSVGSALADTAKRIFDDLGPALRSDIIVERAFETLALVDSAAGLGICGKAEGGAAMAAGAADGRTRYSGWKVFGVFDLGIEAGGDAVNASRTDCHRPKRTLFSDIQRRLVGRFDFSAFTQLAVVRIGDMLIGTGPGEVTTMAGLRMMAAMAEERPPDVPRHHMAILGLANGDLRYITTREEYWAQLYEGGSNIYGPGTAEMIAGRLGRLTASLPSAGSPQPIVRVDSISAKPGKSFSNWPATGPRPDSLRFELSPTCKGDTVITRWYDAPPGSMVPADGLIVAFQRVGNGTSVVDDDIDVEVRAIDNRRQGFLWEARYTPPGGVRPGDRFSVTLLRWEGSPGFVAECGGSG